MARIVRTNSASGGVVSSGAGLSSSEVQALIDTSINNKVQWILDYEEAFSSTPNASTKHRLLEDVDFDAVSSYYCVIKGFASANTNDRIRLHIQNNGTNITSTALWGYHGTYGGTSFSSNTSFTQGEWELSGQTNDTYYNGMNAKVFVFHLNDTSQTNGTHHFACEYTGLVPERGTPSSGNITTHMVNTQADWNGIKFDFGGTNYGAIANTLTTPIIQVYKQLRVPAT